MDLPKKKISKLKRRKKKKVVIFILKWQKDVLFY